MSSKNGSIDDSQDDIEAQIAELLDEAEHGDNSSAEEHADRESADDLQNEEFPDNVHDKGEGGEAAEPAVPHDSNNKVSESVEDVHADLFPKEIVTEDVNPKGAEEASPPEHEATEPKTRRQGLVAKPKKAPATAALTELQADAQAASSVAHADKKQPAAPAAGRRRKIVARTASSNGGREEAEAPPPAAKSKPSRVSKPKVSAVDIANAITEGSKQPAADRKRAKRMDSKPDKADAKPSKPRGKNAFQFFSAEKRTAIKEEEGITAMGQIAKRLGELWNELSAEEKKPYQDMAAIDKQRIQSKEPDASSTKALANKAVKQPQSKSAYLRFCDAYRKEIKDASPDASSVEVTQLLAAAWKDASEEEKEPFRTAHKEEKERLGLVKKTKPTRSSRRTSTADSDAEDIHPRPTNDQEADNDDEAEREKSDWTEHPAEAILGTTLHHKLIVKRKGLPLTDYGLVDARLAKRSRMEETDSPVTLAMLTEYEAWLNKFKKSVAENTHKGVLDLDELPKDSPLEACYYLGKMVEANYMLSKAEKGKDTTVRMPVLGLSMCIQRLLDLERQKASELAKKLQAAENQIKQMASATAAEE